MVKIPPRAWVRRVPLWAWWAFGFVLLCFLYEYGRILHLRPLAHHLWRQTNCLSLTREYYVGEWNLFKPGVQSLIADGLTTGKSAGEFPLLYYVMGMLWKLIGPSEFAYRVLMLAIHAWGSWALCRLVERLTNDRFWGVMVSLFFFTVPAVVYFAIGFLTDVPALDLVLVGCLAYLRYMKGGGKSQLALGTAAFALGMLLKLTAAMLPLALAGIGLLALAFPDRFAIPGMNKERLRRMLASIAVGLMATAAWVAYSYQYNRAHGAEYSYQGTWALWDLSHEDAAKAWDFARTIMVHQFFTLPGYALLVFFGLYLVRYVRSLPKAILLFLAVLVGGVILYTLLWFIALDNHDYYFIAPLVLPIAVVIIALWHMRNGGHLLYRSFWFKGVFLLVTVYQVVFAMNNIRMRQQDYTMAGWMRTNAVEREHWRLTQYWDMTGLLDIEPIARLHGIRPDDIIVAAPDISVCQTLYLSNQVGFNEFGRPELHCPDLVNFVEHGAKYFYLIGDGEELRGRFAGCLGNPLFEHGAIKVYDIRHLADR
ncbi:MAG: glycosyltransferase family 39 protein [Flavobacteriales bacterium]|nr:glycosyltransferase family 39 protein [Flavobacteriales bacterium]